jgi:hypothetical protein
MKKPLTVLQQLRNRRTVEREKIFFHRLAYDLKIAGVVNNRRVHVYSVDVDDSGYDIIVDVGGFERRFQVKTRLRPGGAHTWKCHRLLFCPTPDQVSFWRFQEWLIRHAYGFNGGLIVADIEWPDGKDPSITYRYTDLAILMAFRDGLAENRSVAATAYEVYSATATQVYGGDRTVKVPQSLLVTPKNHVALLDLMGFGGGGGPDYMTAFRWAYSRELRPIDSRNNDLAFRTNFITVLREKLVSAGRTRPSRRTQL